MFVIHRVYARKPIFKVIYTHRFLFLVFLLEPNIQIIGKLFIVERFKSVSCELRLLRLLLLLFFALFALILLFGFVDCACCLKANYLFLFRCWLLLFTLLIFLFEIVCFLQFFQELSRGAFTVQLGWDWLRLAVAFSVIRIGVSAPGIGRIILIQVIFFDL